MTKDLSAKLIPLKTEIEGRQPTTAQCDVGEIAINLTDRKIFSKRSDGQIVTLAGGVLITDAEDFELNPLPNDAVGRWYYTSSSSVQPGRWHDSGSYLRISLTDSFGTDFTSTLENTTLSVWRASSSRGPWTLIIDQIPGCIVSNGYVNIPDAPTQDISGTQYFTFTDPGLSQGYAPLAENDAIVWDGAEHFRPKPFDLAQLGDVLLTVSSTVMTWALTSYSAAAAGLDKQGRWYWQNRTDGDLLYVRPVDASGADRTLAFREWLTQLTGVTIGPDVTASGNWEMLLTIDGSTQRHVISQVADRSVGVSTLYPYFQFKSSSFDDSEGSDGSTLQLPQFEEFLGIGDGQTFDGTVLTWNDELDKFVLRPASSTLAINEATDFTYSQKAPPVYSWSLGDWSNNGQYTRTATELIYSLIDGSDTNRQLWAESAPQQGTAWISIDGGSSFTGYAYDDLTIQPIAFTFTLTFPDDAPPSGPNLRMAWTEPGQTADQPITEGEILTWNGEKWEPQSLTEGVALGLNDLTDVNTVTNPPTDGQALVWSQANGYWQPGAGGGGGAESLGELSDVSLASIATGQVLMFIGTEWVNSKLDWDQIENTPDVPAVLNDLDDVDTSTNVPQVGQALIWDGQHWSPGAGGGGGGVSTFGGALTERGDTTVTETYDVDQNKQLVIQGLGEAGSFVEVQLSHPAWARFYPTQAAMNADALRDSNTDPRPGSGVLLEVLTKTVDEKLVITPGAIYFNNDVLPEQKLYAAVKNLHGATVSLSLTLRTFSQIHCDAVVGGLF